MARLIIVLLFCVLSKFATGQVYQCDADSKLPKQALKVYENHLYNEVKFNLPVPIFFHCVEEKPEVYYKDILVELNNRFQDLFDFKYKGNNTIKNSSSHSLKNISFTEEENVKGCLNIYLINDGSKIKGKASFPGAIESYVIVNQKDYSIANFDINNLVHEIGHYFGLLHTFSSLFGYEYVVNRQQAISTGDLLSDTPAEYNTIYFKKYLSNIHRKLDKGGEVLPNHAIIMNDQCQKRSNIKEKIYKYKHVDSPSSEWKDLPVTDKNGDSYGVLPNNYMSYVTQGCNQFQFSFTKGQLRRMAHYYVHYRSKEFNKTALDDPNEPLETNPSNKEGEKEDKPPINEDGDRNDKLDGKFRTINKETIPITDIEYDGLYFKDKQGYKEILYNKAIQAHFVYSYGSLPWNYPKVHFLLKADLTELSTKPKNFLLVGSAFTNENLNNLKVSKLEHTNSYAGNMMHAVNKVWRDGEDVFFPEFDKKANKYITIDYKKRKIDEGVYELLITESLEEGSVYIIHSNHHFWLFRY